MGAVYEVVVVYRLSQAIHRLIILLDTRFDRGDDSRVFDFIAIQ